MKNYSLPEFDSYRTLINKKRKKGESWDDIHYLNQGSIEGLKNTLQMLSGVGYDKIDAEDWLNLVERQKEAEKQTVQIKYKWQQAILKGYGQDNNTEIPEDPNSSWQLYKRKLLEEKHFGEEVVRNMEQTVFKILRRLDADTRETDPVKGLVIGNVQSGKTANMAGLMAMAADWGWNIFVILSGTIENLREQTENRIYSDLNNQGNLTWKILNHPSKRSAVGYRSQDLFFNEDSKDRYFTVCLKNSKRLKNLIGWMQKDPAKQEQMRVLVIDDEADQASIDTLDINSDEKNAINRLITNLVNGLNEKDKETKAKFMAMNYVGYTATPYANILNDSRLESLYPRNFITTMGVSDTYFGPQQIFGINEGKYDGLDIVRIVPGADVSTIKKIHKGIMLELPESMKNAICWFLCGVAALRVKGYKKPLSMLVHTSQKTAHHDYIAQSINEWLRSEDKNTILAYCKGIWESETGRFSKKTFFEQYPDYGESDPNARDGVDDYPAFSEIEDNLKILINHEPTPIKLESEGELTYHNGVHICIDNCQNNGITDDGLHMRLAYPDAANMPELAPAFIVIGGSTLARGLTIEGLISTFFLRSVGQADTLMQMGRWFGYRRGYELIPRVWITEKTESQFEFLSSLDQELRDEIFDMDSRNITPDHYGPKVKNTPSYQFLRITAKNKMQSAQVNDMDFSGSFNQTYLFDTDRSILTDNKNIVAQFINDLGVPENPDPLNPLSGNDAIWRNIDLNEIVELLHVYHFQDNLHFGNNIGPYVEWLRKITDEGKLGKWNVILSGGRRGDYSDENWNLEHCSAAKVRRSRKKDKTTGIADPAVIDIGVLSDPRDIVADVNVISEDDTELIEKLLHFKSGSAKTIRNGKGMDTIPQLLIYIVDKDSKKSKSENRVDLNAPEDLVGLGFNIPGGKKGENYATSISVKLRDTGTFDDEGDVEDAK